MPLTLQRLSAVPVLAVVALGVAACGSSSSSSTTSSTQAATSSTPATTTSASAAVPVAGRSTVVVVNPATAQVLKKNGVTVTPIAPATAKTGLVFPVSGGKIAVATLAGTVDHTGGLTFSHNGKSVQLTSFIIDTTTKQLTALAGGQRVPILNLNLASLKRASGPNGTVVASDIKLTLTSQAASALNSGLGVSIFTAGLPFGVATLTVAVKS
jgi:hypothetical protein